MVPISCIIFSMFISFNKFALKVYCWMKRSFCSVIKEMFLVIYRMVQYFLLLLLFFYLFLVLLYPLAYRHSYTVIITSNPCLMQIRLGYKLKCITNCFLRLLLNYSIVANPSSGSCHCVAFSDLPREGAQVHHTKLY